MFWPSTGYRLPLTCPRRGHQKISEVAGCLTCLARLACSFRPCKGDALADGWARPLATVEQFVLRAHRRLPIPIYPPLVSWLTNSVPFDFRENLTETDCHTFRFGVWNVALFGNRGSQAALGLPSFRNNVCRARVMFRFVRCQ